MGEIEVVKVVVDTNVLISALLFGGVPGRLMKLWKSRRIQPVVSKAIIDEYLRVLAYPKFQLSRSEIEYLLYQEILPWFETITVSQGGPFVHEDPSDDKSIWCAEIGGVDWIVSGDEHLLNLEYDRIPIVTPASFLQTFEGGK